MVDLSLIVSLLLMLALAKMLGEVFERMLQPVMVGEILAGIILGPALLGWVNYTADINAICDLAVLLLIISAGLEIKVEDILDSVQGKKIRIALLGFFIPFFSGIMLGILFRFDIMVCVFLGLCISITALPVSIRILVDLKRLKTDVGGHIISAAVFNDVLSLLVLGILLQLRPGTYEHWSDLLINLGFMIVKLVVFITVLLLSYKLLEQITQFFSETGKQLTRYLDFLKGKGSDFALVMIFVLMFASLSEVTGLHFVVGAFFGAVLLPQPLINRQRMTNVAETTDTITMGLLAPIFFAAIGLEFSFAAIESYGLLLAVFIISFGSKIVGGYIAGRKVGYSAGKSATIGIGLNARGVVELIIAKIALANGLIDLSLFSILVVMGIVTTLVTPSLLGIGFRYLEKRGEKC
jgi:Kef-type K+ transport system membrane component KefB